ncbi:transferrin-binding protein-like solute binding protein [Pelagibacterium halotolerans]|uniref:transferrin-binding protein-like solute binding protein n=1 Tax=Pelagibacterium halotolerans TaxID=531813 RepID=UPI00384FEDBC
MTQLRFLTLPVIASLALAGCSTTSGGGTNGGGATPPPDPTTEKTFREQLAEGVNAETTRLSQGAVANGTANITMAGSTTIGSVNAPKTLSVTLDGTTYDMTLFSLSTTKGTNYSTFKFHDSADNNQVGTLIVGDNVAVGDVNLDHNASIFGVRAGILTAADAMPNQTASYAGKWHLGASSTGSLDATANFDSGTIAFDIQDLAGAPTGAGIGSISGNSFASSFDIYPSTNTVLGNFYGPDAAEMAGIITGDSAPDVGYLYGSKK